MHLWTECLSYLQFQRRIHNSAFMIGWIMTERQQFKFFFIAWYLLSISVFSWILIDVLWSPTVCPFRLLNLDVFTPNFSKQSIVSFFFLYEVQFDFIINPLCLGFFLVNRPAGNVFGIFIFTYLGMISVFRHCFLNKTLALQFSLSLLGLSYL